ncbi:hypothetical protein J2W32_002104 [Variovorax boronicumulans]|uniref:DUF305 domain-containing protein n=1 Tax=Variovorax boronicumulans TaxID=436515 RepID=A0AAW8CTH4_9BURK|nr:DUF305 domain-containing protein [Variovorax boronicumulans]MDP9891885.1 hypothetical protein [Variovorax boronicumulans]MDQ0053058.1 hypothetical protein [Variovorax boronicumulans]
MSATTPRRKRGIALAAVVGAALVAAVGVLPAAADSIAAAFAAENDAAMNRMMAAMEIKPSGDVDRDFAAMMIPHHQGAIEMAEAELRYGRNEQLRRIAQEIIVEQQQEIAAMHLALGQPLPPSAPAPTQGLSATHTTNSLPHPHTMPGMHMEHRDTP